MVIGPTFARELAAAGLAGIPIAWGSDGAIVGRESLTPQQAAALEAVLAAHDPTRQMAPASVSRLQARVALHRAGLLPQIETAIAQANGELQIYWTDAQVFERESTYIAQIAAAIGLTGEQVDQLFLDAAGVA